MGSSQPHNHDHDHDAHHDPTPAANTGPDCGPDSDPIKRFITLVRGGMTIQTAADTVGIPHYLAYRTAHHHDLPLQRRRTPNMCVTTSPNSGKQAGNPWSSPATPTPG